MSSFGPGRGRSTKSRKNVRSPQVDSDNDSDTIQPPKRSPKSERKRILENAKKKSSRKMIFEERKSDDFDGENSVVQKEINRLRLRLFSLYASVSSTNHFLDREIWEQSALERIVEAYETGELKPSDQMNRPPSPFSPDTPDSSSVSGMGSPHMRMGAHQLKRGSTPPNLHLHPSIGPIGLKRQGSVPSHLPSSNHHPSHHHHNHHQPSPQAHIPPPIHQPPPQRGIGRSTKGQKGFESQRHHHPPSK